MHEGKDSEQRSLFYLFYLFCLFCKFCKFYLFCLLMFLYNRQFSINLPDWQNLQNKFNGFQCREHVQLLSTDSCRSSWDGASIWEVDPERQTPTWLNRLRKAHVGLVASGPRRPRKTDFCTLGHWTESMPYRFQGNMGCFMGDGITRPLSDSILAG